MRNLAPLFRNNGRHSELLRVPEGRHGEVKEADLGMTAQECRGVQGRPRTGQPQRLFDFLFMVVKSELCKVCLPPVPVFMPTSWHHCLLHVFHGASSFTVIVYAVATALQTLLKSLLE